MGFWGINKEMIVESPVLFGPGQYDCGFIGAFSLFNNGSRCHHPRNHVFVDAKSIGRFCMVADRVTVGVPAGHPTEFISPHLLFRYDTKSEWCRDYLHSKVNSEWESQMTESVKKATSKPLHVIGNDVWIGQGATILNGVTIGDGAIIAANSLVTKNVEPYAIVGGGQPN